MFLVRDIATGEILALRTSRIRAERFALFSGRSVEILAPDGETVSTVVAR